jgi:hypothetical protein
LRGIAVTREAGELLQIVTGLMSIGVVLTVLLSPLLLAAWILIPLDRMARQRKVRCQFQLVDYFSLILLIQIPLAVKAALHNDSSFDRPMQDSWVLVVVFCCVSTLIWWTGVRTFGQAGIQQTRARAILGLLVLPLSYFGTLLAVSLIFSLGSDAKWWHVVGLAAIAFAMVCAGRYTRRLTTEWRAMRGIE